MVAPPLLSFNPSEFDPLASPNRPPLGEIERDEGNQAAPLVPETPFSTALRTWSRPKVSAPPFLLHAPTNDAPLIDLAASPGPSAPSSSSAGHLPLPPSITKRPFAAAYTSSVVRRPSPLKFAIFDDSVDASAGKAGSDSPFALTSPTAAVHKGEYRQEEDVENSPIQVRGSGRKWGVMSKVKDEKRRARSRSDSVQLATFDVSLIADEGGSFLLQDTMDVTINSFALSNIGEDDEDEEVLADGKTPDEPSRGMSVMLVDGFGDSLIGEQVHTGRPRFPTSKSSPALSSNSILPPGLVTSTRQSLSRSTGPSDAPSPLPSSRPSVPSQNVEPDIFLSTLEEDADGHEVTFLNSSTASFRDYRDSPVKPRIVSIQAEAWPEDDGGEMLGGRTPRPRRNCTGRILNQTPPTAVLQSESTSTLELGLQSPILPTKPSPAPQPCSLSHVEDLASSTRTVVPTHAEIDLMSITDVLPPPPAPALAPVSKIESGAERLRRRLEELRLQKSAAPNASKATAPAPAPAPASIPATPRQPRLLTKPSLLDATPAASVAIPFAAPRLSTVKRPIASKPSALVRSESTVSVGTLIDFVTDEVDVYVTPAPSTTARSLVAPPKLTTPPPSAKQADVFSAATQKTPGERKDSTKARIDRLREERKQREETRSPVKKLSLATSVSAASSSSNGLKRPSGIVKSSSTSALSLTASRTGLRAPASSATRTVPTLADLRANRPTSLMSRNKFAPSIPKPSSTSSSGLARPSAALRPPTAPHSSSTAPASSVTSRTTTSPRKSAITRPSSSSSSLPGLKRPSFAPTQGGAALPRARVPLRSLQEPSASAGSGIGKAGGSRIGMGRPSAVR
ncbi:SPOSA6832_00548, partial [Sporobolomyces salmonicolor]